GTTAPRLFAPTFAAGAAVTGFHAAHAVALLRAPREDPHASSFYAIFIGQSLAVLGIAFALGWTLAGSRRTRRAVERLIVELAELPRPGALEAALVRATGDPSLKIVYRLRHVDRYVDGQGQAVATPSSSRGRAVTSIVRDGRPVALVQHDPAVLNGDFQSQIGSAAGLAVDNERLQAEALTQLSELR